MKVYRLQKGLLVAIILQLILPQHPFASEINKTKVKKLKNIEQSDRSKTPKKKYPPVLKNLLGLAPLLLQGQAKKTRNQATKVLKKIEKIVPVLLTPSQRPDARKGLLEATISFLDPPKNPVKDLEKSDITFFISGRYLRAALQGFIASGFLVPLGKNKDDDNLGIKKASLSFLEKSNLLGVTIEEGEVQLKSNLLVSLVQGIHIKKMTLALAPVLTTKQNHIFFSLYGYLTAFSLKNTPPGIDTLVASITDSFLKNTPLFTEDLTTALTVHQSLTIQGNQKEITLTPTGAALLVKADGLCLKVSYEH